MLTSFALLYLVVHLLAHVLGEVSARLGLAASAARRPSLRGDPVTLIKPVYGADEFTRAAFVSWLSQDYPGEVQVVFSFQDPLDPALALLGTLEGVPGLRPFEVIVNPIEPGYNGKSSNLLHGVARARHDILVFADADILAAPGTLARLVGSLQDGLEIAGCMIRHTRATDFWGGLYANVWNLATLGSGGIPMRWGFGPALPGGTIAITRRALARVGGVETFGRYVAEDVALGLLADRYRIPRGIGGEVESPVGTLTRAGLFQKLSRLRILRQLPFWPGNLIVVLLCMTGYLVILPLFFASGNPGLQTAAVAFAATRTLLWRRFTRLAEGEARGGLDWIVMDVVVLVAGLRAIVSPAISWAGIRYHIDASGRIVPEGEHRQ